MKKALKKIIIIVLIIISIFFVAVIGFVISLGKPANVLRYKSDDKKISIVITEPSTPFVPARSAEYSLVVKQKEGFLKKRKVLLNEIMLLSSGISDENVDIQWHEKSVDITVHDGKSKEIYNVKWE